LIFRLYLKGEDGRAPRTLNMYNQKKLTMLNKILELEKWFNEYLQDSTDKDLDRLYNSNNYELLELIGRNLSSIKALIKKA